MMLLPHTKGKERKLNELLKYSLKLPEKIIITHTINGHVTEISVNIFPYRWEVGAVNSLGKSILYTEIVQ